MFSVASFIFSHLKNVAKNHFPENEQIKQFLLKVKLPKTPKMIFSKNLNTGFYLQNYQSGINYERNLIFDIKNKFKKYDLNLLLVIMNKLYNIVDISLRVDNAYPLKFGSRETLRLFNLDNVTTIVKKLLLDLFYDDKKDTTKQTRQNTGDSETESEWDVFLRLFEIEMFFTSFEKKKYPEKYLHEDAFKNKIVEAMRTLYTTANILNNNTTRAVYGDIKVFVPTTQGIPLLMKLQTTTLFGYSASKKLPKSSQQKEEVQLKIKPTFSLEIQSFVGFSFGSKVGIRSKYNVNLFSDVHAGIFKNKNGLFKMTFDTPEPTIKIWNVRSHSYLMRKLPQQEDIQLITEKPQSNRIIHSSCLPARVNLYGSKLCWTLNVSDASNISHFGQPSLLTFYMELENPETKAFVLKSSWRKDKITKRLSLDLSTEGSKTQEKGEIKLTHMRIDDNSESFQLYTTRKDDSTSCGLKLTTEEKKTKFGTRKIISLFAANSKKFFPEDMVSISELF